MAKVVACQMVSTPDVGQNLKQVETFLQQLVVDQPILVVLPECFACFGAGDSRQLEIAEPFAQGPIQQSLSAMANKYNVWLVSGTFPVQADVDHKFFASCHVYDDAGQLVTDYQKIHLFDVQVEDNTGSYLESAKTEPGSTLRVIDSPFGRLGIAVCYDIRFAGMFQAMGQIDVLVIPAAFTYKTGEAHWQSLLKARAIEKQCYLVAANQGGVHANGRQTYGHSCIISPWGEELASIESGEGMVESRIDPQLVEKIRSAMPVNQHNKFRSYLV